MLRAISSALIIAGVAVSDCRLAPAQSSESKLREGFVEVPGAKIFYRDSGGTGTPVVFLHAYTGSSEVWERQIPAFTQAGYRFIAYDRRGYGRTVADANGPASTGADDLAALIDHLNLEKFHLIGTAGGGFVAIDFALSYPRRLRSFALLCSTAGVQDPDYVEALQRMRPQGFEKLPNSFLELSPSYRFSNPS